MGMGKMRPHHALCNRRHFLKGAGLLVGGGTVCGSLSPLLAEPMDVLDVASAGSVRAMLDGPLKLAVAERLKLDIHSHSQGADAVARSLVDGSLNADVFVPITAGPMKTVLQAGKAHVAYPVARTEMVLVYSPKSQFAARFDAAAVGKTDWWKILQEPGLRFAHGSPAGDPGGRNAFFLLMLTAKKYGDPKLVERLLGSVDSPSPAAGSNNQEKLRTGELDVSASYRVGVGFDTLPYIVLPKELNLSGDHVATEHPELRLTIDGRTYVPEPLIFYAALLAEAANPTGGARFMEWLRGNEGQALLRSHQYDAPGQAPELRA
jgi:molybdate/tungstate transport system substrate-binding protein